MRAQEVVAHARQRLRGHAVETVPEVGGLEHSVLEGDQGVEARPLISYQRQCGRGPLEVVGERLVEGIGTAAVRVQPGGDGVEDGEMRGDGQVRVATNGRPYRREVAQGGDTRM